MEKSGWGKMFSGVFGTKRTANSDKPRPDAPAARKPAGDDLRASRAGSPRPPAAGPGTAASPARPAMNRPINPMPGAIEWESPKLDAVSGVKRTITATGKAPYDPVRQRIRERYFRARFPDTPMPAQRTEDASSLIKAARLYFEDGDAPRAVELLKQGADLMPAVEGPLLAKLEIHFIRREGPAFLETARIFKERFPESQEWDAVVRLGSRLSPDEPLFLAAGGVRPSRDDHYGAWPECPNWIEAPWDLTGEVLAVELRGRILGAGNTGEAQRA